jgi:hypothetical protein
MCARRSKPPRWMLLGEEHLPGGTFGRTPTLHTALECAQLPVLELARILPLQILEDGLGFKARVRSSSSTPPRPQRTGLAVSAKAPTAAPHLVHDPGCGTSASSLCPSLPWPPLSLGFPLYQLRTNSGLSNTVGTSNCRPSADARPCSRTPHPLPVAYMIDALKVTREIFHLAALIGANLTARLVAAGADTLFGAQLQNMRGDGKVFEVGKMAPRSAPPHP